MNDKFEDKIRESLNNPPDYPFEERVWQDMEERLDQAAKPRRGGGYVAWWAPLLAAAIPLLLFVWLWGAYSQQSTQLASLKTAGSQLSTVQIDTLIQRQVTIVYDTIYRTVVTETQIFTSTSSPSNKQLAATSLLMQPAPPGQYYLPSQSYRQPFNSWNDSAFRGLLNSYTSPLSVQREEVEQTTGATALEEPKNTPVTPLYQNPAPTFSTPLPLLQYTNSESLPALVLPAIKKRKKRLRDHLAPVLPSGLKVGLTAGTLAAKHLPEVEDRANFNVALLAEFSYGRHLSFVFGGEYLTNNFSLSEDDDFSNFPVLPPNNAGDELESLEGDFRYWQFPLGVKYHFMVQRRLSPYLGIGLVGVRPTESRLSYEYEDSSDNYYLLSQNDLLARKIIFQDAWLTLGTEYYLGSNWSLLLDISSQWSFREANSALDKRAFLKARLGVGYSF